MGRRALMLVAASLATGCKQESARQDPADRHQGAVIDCRNELGDTPPRFAAVVDAFCTDAVAAGVPGASLAVADAGELVLELSYGVRCAGEPQRVTSATRFRAGSITKALTAATVVVLAGRGLLRLDMPAASAIDGLPGPAGGATLRQLLDHTSGLADVLPTPKTAKLHGPALLQVLTAGARAPGTWRYANTGYYLAGLAIEHATGRDYAAATREAVLDPLGLADATFDLAGTEAEAACGHMPGLMAWSRTTVVEDFERYAYGALWTRPAGGLVATAGDVARFAVALGGGPGPLGDLANQIDGTAVPTDTPGTRYALGFRVRAPVAGAPIMRHSGNTGDFSAEVAWVPQRRFAAVVMANAGRPLRSTVTAALREIAGVDG